MKRLFFALTVLAAGAALTAGLSVAMPDVIVIAPGPPAPTGATPVMTTQGESAVAPDVLPDEIEHAVIGSIARSELPMGGGFGTPKLD